MSIQRIDIPKKRTHGWQARATIDQKRRSTKFVSDSRCGGCDGSYGMALIEERKLWAQLRDGK